MKSHSNSMKGRHYPYRVWNQVGPTRSKFLDETRAKQKAFTLALGAAPGTVYEVVRVRSGLVIFWARRDRRGVRTLVDPR